MIQSPGRYIRTTLADDIPDEPGIYILAYMGRIVYIGKAEISVFKRITNHMNSAQLEQLGAWLVCCNDPYNIRLDVLTTPVDVYDARAWLNNAERACINKFSPLFNDALM